MKNKPHIMIASRSIFQTLTRRLKSIASLTEDPLSRPIYLPGKCDPYRRLCSGSATSDLEEDLEGKDDLKSRILRLRLPKRSVINVLQRWVGEGNQVNLSELRQISTDLRKSHRFKHALEISEWMVGHEHEFDLLDSDYAVRIDLMTKVFGIDSAERYFEALPDSAKTTEICTALLHCYASAKMIEKAEKLFESTKDLPEISFSAIAYNEMMTMYVSLGQVEKVFPIIEELKRKCISPDLFTYNLWISSCASTMRIEEAKRVLDEMRSDPSLDESSKKRYIDLANVYIATNRLMNCDSDDSVVSVGKGGVISQREWITYDFLVILHAGLGNKERVDQIWKSLRLTGQKMTSRNYVCVLASYLISGHLKEVGEIMDQWKQSVVTPFSVSACERLFKAVEDIGLEDKARDFHLLLIQKKSDLDESLKL